MVHLLAGPIRLVSNWYLRRKDQAAFAGRIFLLGLMGLGGTTSLRQLLIRHLLIEVYTIAQASYLLIVVFGFLVGFLWTAIWFGVLSNIGGASTLTSLVATVQVQEVTPILVTIVVIMRYGCSMTLEIALKKSSGQFVALELMGIPPEHFLAWPRLLAPVLAFPVLMLVMNMATLAGVYFGIWQAIDLPVVEYVSDVIQNLKTFNIFKLALKSILISSCLSFFCLYNGWQIREDNINFMPRLIRRAMGESFFFSTLFGVMITILYD